MLTIAYIGNGKSTNRYHLPFSTKLTDKIKVKTIYSPSGKITWEKVPGVTYTTEIDTIYLCGGTTCLTGIEGIFEKVTGIRTIKPANPFLVTPAGIAKNCILSER